MHIGVFLSVVKLVGDDLFAVAVREENYGARGDDTDERGPEATYPKRCLCIYVKRESISGGGG